VPGLPEFIGSNTKQVPGLQRDSAVCLSVSTAVLACLGATSWGTEFADMVPIPLYLILRARAMVRMSIYNWGTPNLTNKEFTSIGPT